MCGYVPRSQQQCHSRSTSEVTSSEMSGSSVGVWEDSIRGSIVHPCKFPLVLVQVGGQGCVPACLA